MNDELRFTIRPDWQEIDRINEQAREFLGRTSLPEPEIDTYTMVVCELLENGIKYGRPNENISVTVRIADDTIMIQVSNKVRPDARLHLEELDRTLQWIRGIQDPYQAYLERVLEISRESLSETKSCLGLVRIAYEGGAEIDFVLDEDDTLSVSAVAQLR
ncbi:MAG: hypothetical protein JJU06_10380 [Ectothiorhodospiraceae bacterium]|nr:hypothetical protein [Ectothiorhodospiraceae bacterium]MCH8504139.1 hypothetical protein [Ectothiorhodospiraceae bacterium]